MELTSDSSLRPKQDICVLNSVVNVQTAADFIRSHQAVHLYLDNDEAGRRTSQEIADYVLAVNPEAIITNHSEEYRGFNDLNERLQDSVQRERLPPKIEQSLPPKSEQRLPPKSEHPNQAHTF